MMGRSRRSHPEGWLILALLALPAIGGCDRWPWETKAASNPSNADAHSSSTALPTTAPFIPEQDTVAKINVGLLSTTDVELKTLELKQLVQAYQQTWEPLSAEESPDKLDLHDVLSNLVEAELKTQDIRTRGLGTEGKRRFAYLERSFYAQEWDRWQRERAAPSQEEIHQFYEQSKLGFVEPERLHAKQIVTETLADAEAIRAQAVQGAIFAQLARERSIGPGKEQGGDIGWYLRAVDKERLRLMGGAPSESAFFPQLEPMAFALEIGQVSQPVKGPDGRYYVIQIEERKPSRQQTELEVQDAIKELLTLRNLQRKLEELQEKATVQEFPERLQGVKQ